MFTKAQLIERGRHYFDSKDVNKMYATSDGNFFYEDSKSYADSHSKSLKTPVIEITRGDLKDKPKEKAEKTVKAPKIESSEKLSESLSENSFDELKAEAKKLKIKGWAIMKEETLKIKIAEANGTT